jgi:3-methyl-2-oxobutanoate hydroxymethyltransferase
MSDEIRKIGIRDLRRRKEAGEPSVVVTAYDALMARLVDDAGVDVVLVGDTLGMTVLGYKTTLPVTLADCLRHTAAVVRGVRRAMVVGDMPFLTSHLSPDQVLLNAGRFLQEAGADAIKLEGGAEMADTVRRMVRAGIPVMGHVGLLPQSVLTEGGYRVHGRKEPEAERIMADARALAEAGAFAVVVEGVIADLGKRISEELAIPTIGIGAGPNCDGQVQVLHDILGLFEDFVPKHTKRYAELGTAVREAVSAYCDDVRQHRFPGEAQFFK